MRFRQLLARSDRLLHDFGKQEVARVRILEAVGPAPRLEPFDRRQKLRRPDPPPRIRRGRRAARKVRQIRGHGQQAAYRDGPLVGVCPMLDAVEDHRQRRIERQRCARSQFRPAIDEIENTRRRQLFRERADMIDGVLAGGHAWRRLAVSLGEHQPPIHADAERNRRLRRRCLAQDLGEEAPDESVRLLGLALAPSLGTRGRGSACKKERR